jgi:hypothetical protein
MTELTRVTMWTDPSCPWAWQALTWLRDLRDRGVIDLTYELFSLEMNARAPWNATPPILGCPTRRLPRSMATRWWRRSQASSSGPGPSS